jgi:glycosyltransferase involved in cell wall biosynthesis
MLAARPGTRWSDGAALSQALSLSIVVPAKNEAESLPRLIPMLRASYPEAEVIVVDDGSTDATASLCQAHTVRVVSHPYSMGNGAAIKTGARAASGDTLVFLDADGQHDSADIAQLLAKLNEGYDMVVGARTNGSQASLARGFANTVYNRLASYMVGHRVSDLTSGFRAVRAERFREFLYLLPNGFSYPTTITMAFFRAGYPVTYVPIHAHRRCGKSHLRPVRDGARFFLIIFRVGTLYSPLKLFAPVSAAHLLAGLANYAYTFLVARQFTNMSALLLASAVFIFLIGLISEQITNLLYSRRAS